MESIGIWILFGLYIYKEGKRTAKTLRYHFSAWVYPQTRNKRERSK